mgnify:CR=1 FL=1
MKKSDFYYDLPSELIAQTPLERRDASRLLTLDKRTGATEHHVFHELPDFLNEGDCLVMNDSRVIPARLFGTRPTGGSVEVVLLRDLGGGDWECLTRPGRKTQPGTHISFGNGELTAEVIRAEADGNKVLHFNYDGIFLELLDKLGKMPLPPYIKEELTDKERYQTVYSRDPGSAAAPTAGLHFTPELMERVRARGADFAEVLLHIGLGTFRPVKAEKVTDHEMHTEHYEISPAAAEKINAAKREGRRVIAVGTTAVRVLESTADENGFVKPCTGDTKIFIYPPYRFKCVDALITNFHLPESTLIMLVSALIGHEQTLKVYETAVKERYRFFSFGDSCFFR